MRLSEREIDVITEVLIKYFGETCLVTLFGSRTDDDKLGGDIDLLVEHNRAKKEELKLKLKALSEMQIKLGDRKFDLITKRINDNEDDRLVVSEAKDTGVILWKK